MKRNLLKELDAQKKRISDIECKRKQQDELMIEINTKNKEIIEAKKAKKSLKAIFSTKVHIEDPLFASKMDKFNEEVLFYNQSIKDAQNEIKIKNTELKEMNERNLTGKSTHVKRDKNEEQMKYNFSKRKSKFTNKDVLCKKKMRKTEEGKEKQRMIDNESKKKIRNTPGGQKKQKEVNNA